MTHLDQSEASAGVVHIRGGASLLIIVVVVVIIILLPIGTRLGGRGRGQTSVIRDVDHLNQ